MVEEVEMSENEAVWTVDGHADPRRSDVNA